MKWVVGCLVAVLAVVSGFAVAHEKYADDDNSSSATVATTTVDAGASDTFSDCSKRAKDPCEEGEVHGDTTPATRTSAGFVATGTEAPQQTYVKDIVTAGANNWGLAMSRLVDQLKARSGGSNYVVLGGTDGGYWDLNRGAGGHFVFMGYTTTTNPAEAVTDIQFNMPQANIVGDRRYPKGVKGPAYQLMGATDVNSPNGKGRPGIGVYYSNEDNGTPANPKPLTGIGLLTCWDKNRRCDGFTPADAASTQPWQKLGQDLNAGVRGNWIFLQIQRAA